MAPEMRKLSLLLPKWSRQFPWKARPYAASEVGLLLSGSFLGLILLALSTVLVGNKICSLILSVVCYFCIYCGRGFSEMFQGLFLCKGVAEIPSERPGLRSFL